MSVRDKWVRRFSIDETTKHKNGFTIYKITSVLFPLESPEAVTVVSVWKRYSDVQRLHKSMRSLHAGLHLRGTFPSLAKSSFFKRFQPEIIDERAKSIKTLLEFIAEHRLLFTSTDFVNFLQTGYPEPEPKTSVINAIRSSLHLPIEESPPLEYQTSDDETRSPVHSASSAQRTQPDGASRAIDDRTEIDVSQIPIYEAADVEIRESPENTRRQSLTDSFESLSSLVSVECDFYDELSKITIEKSKPCVKTKSVLPDLIIFDAPSTSTFDDYDTISKPSNTAETESLHSNLDSLNFDTDSRRSVSCVSLNSKRSVLSLSNVDSKTRTEDSYIFEAGYILNLAARSEDTGDYQRAFEYYKSGIEKMLIGVQSDSNQERRAIIKEKTNKYLAYAEAIYKNHLCNVEQTAVEEGGDGGGVVRAVHCAMPLSMVRRPYEELGEYRVLAVLGPAVMLVLHGARRACYAMKVIRKIPNNLTEFDGYFMQGLSETRQPILPTVIPYMVPLQALIETSNLYFLILSYAPGKKLFDYIKNYAKSVPTTPAREVNLENVFSEPMVQKNDLDNDNIKTEDTVDSNVNADKSSVTHYLDGVNENIVETDSLNNVDLSVKELVSNSQKLLMNVDRVLCEVSSVAEGKRDKDSDETVAKKEREDAGKQVETSSCKRVPGAANPRDLLPPSTVCKWGAEILTALESLHNCGVVCRDLNPSNILLGSRGQVLLTYMSHHPGSDAALALVRRPRARSHPHCVAPELLASHLALEGGGGGGEHVCDYWSFGVIMYELLCGVPLWHYHRGPFTSHTILQMPDGLPIEVQSLLTQLLTYSPSERLGAGKDGIDEIKHHPYFRHIDWRAVYDAWVMPD